MPSFIDITGKKFGRWLVKEKCEKRKCNQIYWKCVCECGNEKDVNGTSLRNGLSTSCGCYHKELVAEIGRTYKGSPFKHGHRRSDAISRTYSIWCSMKTRATNRNYKQAKDYVDRGISICEEWKKSFVTFLNDMGEAPSGLQIDRIDNNGNYEPLNCRWVTPKENCNNKRNNISNHI